MLVHSPAVWQLGMELDVGLIRIQPIMGLAAVEFRETHGRRSGQDGDVTPDDPEPSNPGANHDSFLEVVPEETVADVKLPGDGRVRLALSPVDSPRDVVRMHHFQVSPSRNHDPDQGPRPGTDQARMESSQGQGGEPPEIGRRHTTIVAETCRPGITRLNPDRVAARRWRLPGALIREKTKVSSPLSSPTEDAETWTSRSIPSCREVGLQLARTSQTAPPRGGIRRFHPLRRRAPP